MVFYVTETDDNNVFTFLIEMNRLVSDSNISQAFSKALKVKCTSSLKVKYDLKEILYMSMTNAEIVY